MLRDLRRNLDRELDFRLEAENAARLMKSLGGRKGITVPRIVPEVDLRSLAVTGIRAGWECSGLRDCPEVAWGAGIG